MRHVATVLSVASLLALPAAVAAAPPPSVRLLAPKRKATVPPTVLVQFAAKGVEIVPASGLKEEGKAHYHLFVDADVTPADSVIPKTAQIFHLGNGKDTVTVSNLAPGKHRLIAVLAWGTHVPVAGAATDTITITVKP